MLHKAFGNSQGTLPIYALPRPKSRNQYLFIVFIVTVIQECQHRRGEERGKRINERSEQRKHFPSLYDV